jgi:hypothetical protein
MVIRVLGGIGSVNPSASRVARLRSVERNRELRCERRVRPQKRVSTDTYVRRAHPFFIRNGSRRLRTEAVNVTAAPAAKTDARQGTSPGGSAS